MDAELRVAVVAPFGESELLLESEPQWIGRSPECAIVLPSNVVSRKHVALSRRGGDILIQDCSQNGSLVDGLLLRQAVRVVKRPSAVLKIGPFEMQIKRVGAPGGEQARVEVPRQHRAAAPEALVAADAGLRRRLHRSLLDHLDLPKLNKAALDVEHLRPQVLEALRGIVRQAEKELPAGLDQEALVRELANEALGLGALESLLQDEDVSEIMVVDPHTIYAERNGKLTLTGLRFTDDETVRAVVERIVTPLGRRIDESNPIVDARLKDGSRVNAVIPPLALRGVCITIRKFRKVPLTMKDLVEYGSLSQAMATFLERAVRVRKNVVISGGTGSGKTTLLNVLSGAISDSERLVTIEDAAELQLRQPHVVSLEARPANLEGKGEYSIRDLLKNALRMRPDRIIVGECRGGEALDMLQAMNTGHEGSMTTTHANSPQEAIARMETLCLMSGLDLPISAIRRQIASSIHVIVQQARLSDGSRKVTRVAEVVGLDDRGLVELRDLFEFHRIETEPDGTVRGEHRSTGNLPSFIDEFVRHGFARVGAQL